jgi:hypothetical protein
LLFFYWGVCFCGLTLVFFGCVLAWRFIGWFASKFSRYGYYISGT